MGPGWTLRRVTAAAVDLGPGASTEIRATLAPGTWKLWCSLFEGTPESHELLGMVSTIEARQAPARRLATARRAASRRR